MNRTKFICIAAAAILLIAGIAGSLAVLNMRTSHNMTAHIYQHGQLIQSINLSDVTESYTFDIESADGAYNTIEVRPGEIAVIDASCPDKVCVNMGFIRNSALPITCLPNEHVIRIEDGSPDDGIDGISR